MPITDAAYRRWSIRCHACRQHPNEQYPTCGAALPGPSTALLTLSPAGASANRSSRSRRCCAYLDLTARGGRSPRTPARSTHCTHTHTHTNTCTRAHTKTLGGRARREIPARSAGAVMRAAPHSACPKSCDFGPTRNDSSVTRPVNGEAGLPSRIRSSTSPL